MNDSGVLGLLGHIQRQHEPSKLDCILDSFLEYYDVIEIMVGKESLILFELNTELYNYAPNFFHRFSEATNLEFYVYDMDSDYVFRTNKNGMD